MTFNGSSSTAAADAIAIHGSLEVVCLGMGTETVFLLRCEGDTGPDIGQLPHGCMRTLF